MVITVFCDPTYGYTFLVNTRFGDTTYGNIDFLNNEDNS